MFNEIDYNLVIPLVAGLSVILVVLFVDSLRRKIPKENRIYMDPVPFLMKPIWPLLGFFGLAAQILPFRYMFWIRKKLQRSELIYLFTPEQFFGLQVLSSIVFIFIAWLSLFLLGDNSLRLIIFAGVLGFVLPIISMNDRSKKREKQIVKALPVYLDYITMGVQAGLNFGSSLMQATEKGPEGPLKREFMIVQRDIRAGIPRVEAMRNMSERLNIKEIKSLVSTIAQAEKTGADLGASLKVQADQRRIERFQRAEKLALEAPVKLIFPLVAFIFPTTFLILLFPIAMQLRDAL